ncbi:MAG TPA: hypothetical protein VMC84_06470 [Methanocella sp.]|uniref:hypothetical protein n=1 Tax=Methanocella sp. TaxID=2052833 RepID=UPI002BEE93E4|nr:hypothetical protein [Methanocella sp.]HTY90805.1 hypothetical protein [Methanocella sp.]
MVHLYLSFLEYGHSVEHSFQDGRGGYFYVVEGRPVALNDKELPDSGPRRST